MDLNNSKNNIPEKEVKIIDNYNTYKQPREIKYYRTKQAVAKGISFGSCLAIVISYTANHSIGWAIFHGCLSWFYVIYYFFKYNPNFF